MSAEERREAAVRAAVIEFARGGFEGTSTAAIARRIGVSQPYLFRLFPTKRALFLAAMKRSYTDLEEALRTAADGLSGQEAIGAMGNRYRELVADSAVLQFQLQTYAAALDDEEIRDYGRERLAGIWRTVAEVSGEEPQEIMRFISVGMLLNVLTAYQIPYAPGRTVLPDSLADWAAKA